MDANAIASLVGSLGFPIVCCGVMFYFIDKTMKQFTETTTATLEALNNSIIALRTEVETIVKFRDNDNG